MGEAAEESPGRGERLRLRIIALRSQVPWWGTTILAALLMAGLMGLSGLRDLEAIQDRTIEHAEVVAVDGRGTGFLDGCGKSDGPRADVTWRSSDPPAGYRPTFTDRGSCDGDVEVGESYRIVRSDSSADPSVTVDPVTSWRQVGQLAGFGGAAALAALLLVQGVRAAWRRWGQPARIRRRNRAVDF